MPNTPSLILVGATGFGTKHLEELLQLQQEGRLRLQGIYAGSAESREALRSSTPIPVLDQIDEAALQQADAVSICTPTTTHLDFIRQCLPHCHVLVEKPLCASEAELAELEALAGSHSHQLMVGHNYRFEPVIEKLKALADECGEAPELVRIDMVNHGSGGDKDPNLEWIHAYDLMQHLFGLQPEVISGARTNGLCETSLRYGPGLHCVMRLGWSESQAQRGVELQYPGRSIRCDLLSNSIELREGNRYDCFSFPRQPVALRRQYQAFLSLLQDEADNPMPLQQAAPSVRLALAARPAAVARRPRVAVVGGGMFGANCALELADHCDVVLFERHDDLMQEASFINQWRHHSGFHYPRSYDTIQEIRACRDEFEAEYGEAILRDYPSYFCPSAFGVEIPAERYVAACSSNYLSYSFEYPPDSIVDRSSIALSLKSDEGVYDYERLKRLVRTRLEASENIELRLGCQVSDADMLANAHKRLHFRAGSATGSEEFDYVINTTYSNLNLFASWFGFPVEPLRFDLYEMLVLRLPIEQICVTILDGPFTSLVGMGHDNLFLLSHIHDSVSKSDIPADGMPPAWQDVSSNRANMLASAARYMPILAQAEVVESRYCTRAVNAFARDFDARPTVVRRHGFGCWSVLGGKIITCVSNAREISAAIRAENAAG